MTIYYHPTWGDKYEIKVIENLGHGQYLCEHDGIRAKLYAHEISSDNGYIEIEPYKPLPTIRAKYMPIAPNGSKTRIVTEHVYKGKKAGWFALVVYTEYDSWLRENVDKNIMGQRGDTELQALERLHECLYWKVSPMWTNDLVWSSCD